MDSDRLQSFSHFPERVRILLRELGLLIMIFDAKMVYLHVIRYPITEHGNIRKTNELLIHFYRRCMMEKCIILSQ